MTKSVARCASDIAYGFRPTSYFNNLDPDTLIVASILGEERRKDVQQRLAAGDTLAGEDWLTESQLDDATRNVIGSRHPAYMGGEYLPTIGDEEIEIARIVLASVTQDVISVRARRAGKRIAYRVVDEYDTEFALAKKSSAQPLSLKELIQLIDGTNQEGGDSGLVFSVLDMNLEYESDPDSLQDFIAVSSSFYPELGQHYAVEIDGYLADKLAAEEEDHAEVVVAGKSPCVRAQQMPTQLYDLQNLPEDPVLGAIRAAEAAFKARSTMGNKADTKPQSSELVGEAGYMCVKCKGEAGHIRLFGDPSSSQIQRTSFTGSLTARVPADQFSDLRSVIEQGDARRLHGLDLEYAPFYCPKCDAVYCGSHWVRWDVFDEDGWHDCIRGRCPNGHERILED